MQAVWLLSLFFIIIVIGESIVIAFGLFFLDRWYPSLSVTISIFLYLAVIIFAWKLAVRLTEPKAGSSH